MLFLYTLASLVTQVTTTAMWGDPMELNDSQVSLSLIPPSLIPPSPLSPSPFLRYIKSVWTRHSLEKHIFSSTAESQTNATCELGICNVCALFTRIISVLYWTDENILLWKILHLCWRQRGKSMSLVANWVWTMIEPRGQVLLGMSARKKYFHTLLRPQKNVRRSLKVAKRRFCLFQTPGRWI